jgi:hypothetical protein
MDLNFEEIDNLDNNYQENFQTNYQDIFKSIHKDSSQTIIKPNNKPKNKTKNKTKNNSQDNYQNQIVDNYQNNTQNNITNTFQDNYQHEIRDIKQNNYHNYTPDKLQNNTQEIIKDGDEKYWSKPIVEKKNTKKVSFDDILTNMNLVVNEKGVLQFMAPLIEEEEPFYPSTYTYYPNQYARQIRVNKKPLEPELKNSFIYNKYFKNYKDQCGQQSPSVRVPKTMEEYKRMLLEDKIKRIQERNRISKIKPTKLLFENTGNIVATKNSLRKMSFK